MHINRPTLYPGLPDRIELIGTEGTAVLSGDTLDAAFADGSVARVGGEKVIGSGADPMAFGHDMHRALIGNFLAAVRGEETLRVSGEDDLRAHRFIEQILAAGKRPG